jgi:hypothetical protein
MRINEILVPVNNVIIARLPWKLDLVIGLVVTDGIRRLFTVRWRSYVVAFA